MITIKASMDKSVVSLVIYNIILINAVLIRLRLISRKRLVVIKTIHQNVVKLIIKLSHVVPPSIQMIVVKEILYIMMIYLNPNVATPF